MKTLLFFTGCLFIVITLIPLIRKDHWMIRGFDFPHVQITVINAIILTLFLVFFEVTTTRDFIFVAFLGGCLIYQSVIIFPYTPLARKKVKKSKHKKNKASLSLMVTNVLMDNKNVEQCLDIIREADPDLLLMVETNRWWQSQIKEVMEEKYNFCIERPLENTYGMLLYSKLELKDSQVKFLIQEDVPSFHTKVVLRSGQEIFLHCVHPEPPAPDENETSTERDAELLKVGKEIVNEKSPSIVAGDLNDVAWSYTTRLFIKISGLLDPRMGRGFFNTFHAKYALMRWPLDHIFISYHFKLLNINRLPYYGSDHFPMLIELNYEPDGESKEEVQQADAEEKEFAEEKIEKAE